MLKDQEMPELKLIFGKRAKTKLDYSQQSPLLIVCNGCVHLVLDLMNNDNINQPTYICIAGMDRLDVFWRKDCPNQLILQQIENKKE